MKLLTGLKKLRKRKCTRLHQVQQAKDCRLLSLRVKGRVRNYWLEKILDLKRYDCPNKEQGCMEKLQRQNLQGQHANLPLQGLWDSIVQSSANTRLRSLAKCKGHFGGHSFISKQFPFKVFLITDA